MPETAHGLLAALIDAAQKLGLELSIDAARRLLAITTSLADWNTRVNLTAITEPREMLTHHLLDSLSIHAHVRGARIADVGTGAGFPGLPLALVQPTRHFTLIDSVAKKLRFVEHVAQLVGLHNVTTVHARSEQFPRGFPADQQQAFDTVLARALKPLPELVRLVRPLCSATTWVLAMKGPRADEEIAALGRDWRIESVIDLRVPGLDGTRKLITLRIATAV